MSEVVIPQIEFGSVLFFVEKDNLPSFGFFSTPAGGKVYFRKNFGCDIIPARNGAGDFENPMPLSRPLQIPTAGDEVAFVREKSTRGERARWWMYRAHYDEQLGEKSEANAALRIHVATLPRIYNDSRADFDRVCGGLRPLQNGIQSAADVLRLSPEQFQTFLRCTPQGKVGRSLQIEYEGRRDTSRLKDYTFATFVLECLSAAGKPYMGPKR